MGRSYDMNEQVLFDILLCLPVKSLLRFKAVCKDWFSLIESSSFNSEYINYHRNSREDSLIILGSYNDERKLALLSGSKYEECDYDIENWQFWHPASAVRLIGHCDGIVCLAHEDEIALWNPALKQLRPLPPSLFSSPIQAYGTGLGIDIKGNDYKVVRIGLEYGNSIKEMIGNQVEVYNLARGNFWRITHKDDVLPFGCFYTFAAISSSKSGMCFWLAYDFGDQILLSFDFNEDLFRVMPVPHINDGLPSRCRKLDLLDDKVVCIMETFKSNLDFYDVNCEIWMLHEFGVEDSWNKIYKIGPMMLWDLIRPLGISKNGEFLICCEAVREDEDVGELMFCLYNLHTQQGIFHNNRKLEFSFGPFNHSFGQFIHYNASLLSLKSANSVVRSTW